MVCNMICLDIDGTILNSRHEITSHSVCTGYRKRYELTVKDAKRLDSKDPASLHIGVGVIPETHVHLSKQRESPCQLIHRFFRSADGNTEIGEGIFLGGGSLINKFIVGLAALCRVGEIHHSQFRIFRQVKLFPELPYFGSVSL